MAGSKAPSKPKSGGYTMCLRIALVLAIIIVPWIVRVSYIQLTPPQPSTEFSGPTETVPGEVNDSIKVKISEPQAPESKFVVNTGDIVPSKPAVNYDPAVYVPPIKEPVLGKLPTNGTKPMLGKHTGRDAIFALAAGYPLELFKFFVGSVRHFGYKDDIVLAVNPQNVIRKDVYEYLKKTDVVAYGFDVDCDKKDSCRLRDDFLGSVLVGNLAISCTKLCICSARRYPDPRPYRPFANIRYALYGENTTSKSICLYLGDTVCISFDSHSFYNHNMFPLLLCQSIGYSNTPHSPTS